MPGPLSRQSADAALVRALGLWGLAASIVNITIGGGIFRLPAAVAGVLAALAVLNMRGIQGASRFNAVVTVAKLLPLAFLTVIGLVAMHPRNLSWQSAPTVPAVARASAFLMFAFLGVESALVPSGEV